MKKSKLKLSEREFKRYLLENYIDNNLNKVSDRELWSRKEFFEYTGMYSINKYTKEKQMLSAGVISYWKNKLKIKEKDVYNYHITVTGKLIGITYEEWSKLNNKGHTRIKTLTEDTIKRKLIKYVGLSDIYKQQTFGYVQESVYRFWKGLGLDAEQEMIKFYIYLKEVYLNA